MNQFVLQKMLEKLPLIAKLKVKILTASNGKEAFEIFLNNEVKVDNLVFNNIKIIFMDCEMPIIDGY